MVASIDFRGKTVLVTGATRGIGAAIAKDFRDAGADLVLTGTHREKLRELREVTDSSGTTNTRYVHADFRNNESLQGFLEEIRALPRIDVCVNNAGINRNNLIMDMKDEDYRDIMRVNLEAPALICREVGRRMQRACSGRIVNIGSIWTVISKAGRGVYAATKAGLAALTRTLAVDLAPYNVLVNTVSPGFTMTELTEAMLTSDEIAQLAAQVPLHRFAEPPEMAKVVLFLASDLNTYLTGQNIVVDGGFTSV